MAYDFLGLVNDVNNRLNEVELDSTNFATATGYFSFAKDAVNSSIRHINQEEFQWPWNHVTYTETTTTGTARYSYPNDAKTIDMNTFRLKPSSTLNVGASKLQIMSYEEYIERHPESEYSTGDGVPTHVIRTPSRELIFYPNPNAAYDIDYEYYRSGYDLINATDVPALPEQYRFCIIDGAMHYVYQFRGDSQNSQLAQQKFEQGIKHLRSLNINRMDYLRDTRVYY